MTVDKIIYDHLLCESRTIERAIYKMYVPGIISIDGTNISIHKVLSVFIAPQYSDGQWCLFMDLEYINNSGTYQHKRGEFDRFIIGGV